VEKECVSWLGRCCEKELVAARKNADMLEREIQELKQERELVKNRVESLLDNLTEITEESVV